MGANEYPRYLVLYLPEGGKSRSYSFMKICPKCKLKVKWSMASGHWRLLDSDGKEHYDTCAKEWWRIVKTFGTRFETKNNSGFILHGKKFYDWKRGPVITGERYIGPITDDLENSPNPWAKVYAS